MGCPKLTYFENSSTLKVAYRSALAVEKTCTRLFIFNRKSSAGEYRYGFNEMESDDEVKGQSNSYDFGARMYDNRLGRWFSIDAYEDVDKTFHLGKMTLSYQTKCNTNTCTTNYQVDDNGFVDPNEIEGNFKNNADNFGDEAELGGTPYNYDSYNWTESYDNPGYSFDDEGNPKPIKEQ